VREEKAGWRLKKGLTGRPHLLAGAFVGRKLSGPWKEKEKGEKEAGRRWVGMKEGGREEERVCFF
jgi:hypothetical protein